MNEMPRRFRADEFTAEEKDTHFGPSARQELPCNIEAEQALLGALLMKNDVLLGMKMPISARHFFEPIHQQIFEQIEMLVRAGRRADPITVKQGVEDVMIGEMTIGRYLARLAAECVGYLLADDYARAIVETAGQRACVTLGDKLMKVGYAGELEIMDEFEALRAKFEEVSAALNSQEKTKTLASASIRSLEATAEAFAGRGVTGVDYGLTFLMQMIGPLLPGQLIIMGGMTKHGKSSLIEQMIAGAAINGHPVWVNSGEQKDEELARRAFARLTDVKAWQQVRGKISDAEYERLEMARRKAETWQERVYIRDESMTLRQIERDLMDFAKRNPGGMAVIDHVGLIEKDSAFARMSDAEFASVATRKLKVLAGKLNIPIVAAAQLKKNIFEITDKTINRKTYMKVLGRRPRAADIFGSCEKDADHVIAPFRAEAVMDENEPAEMDDLHVVWDEVMGNVRGTAEMVLALSRHTRWPQRRQVGWNGGKTMFYDLAETGQGRMF